MSKPIINIDVDGVLYSFGGAMREELHLRGWDNAFDWPDPDGWDFAETWPVSKKEFYQAMFNGIAEQRVFRRGDLIDPKAPEVMRLIKANGWHIQLVTAKTFSDRDATFISRLSTLRWLHNQDIPYDTIVFSYSKIGKLCYKADATVDDHPQTLRWAQWGADNFLFSQKWNERVQTPGGGKFVKRIHSFTEIPPVLFGERREDTG